MKKTSMFGPLWAIEVLASKYAPTEYQEARKEILPLIQKYDRLGPNARRVLLAIADRLVKGIEHGDFDKPHDWDKESAEEALDLAVYQAAKLLDLGKEEPRIKSSDVGGYEFIDGKSYRRFYDETRMHYVDDDGRTPDGKPWVPPDSARVRVVARSPRTSFNVGEILTLALAWEYNEAWVECRTIAGVVGWVRVVPA